MKPFSLSEIIQNRVNKEAIYLWVINKESTPIPKYVKPVLQREKVGWFNFFRVLLP